MNQQFLHLNSQIECIQDRQNHSRCSRDGQNISSLYQTAKNVLGSFQQQIQVCKKYNQAKIHRKYQIIIEDLKMQNHNLKEKMRFELKARPSSQTYVSDLIQKMIELRNTNEELRKQNINLRKSIKDLQKKYKPIVPGSHINDQDNPQNNQIFEKQWQKQVILATANKFLAQKRNQKSIDLIKQSTSFEKFLQFNYKKIGKWYLLELFQRINKWTKHLKDIRFLDKSRIKLQLDSSLQKNNQTLQKSRQEKKVFKKTISNASNMTDIGQIHLKSHHVTKVIGKNRRDIRPKSILRSERNVIKDLYL